MFPSWIARQIDFNQCNTESAMVSSHAINYRADGNERVRLGLGLWLKSTNWDNKQIFFALSFFGGRGGGGGGGDDKRK
jgi:hypothetical protein